MARDYLAQGKLNSATKLMWQGQGGASIRRIAARNSTPRGSAARASFQCLKQCWYDLTSAQEARPQPTSDEAKGRRDETKATAGAPSQREESVHERLHPEVEPQVATKLACETTPLPTFLTN